MHRASGWGSCQSRKGTRERPRAPHALVHLHMGRCSFVGGRPRLSSRTPRDRVVWRLSLTKERKQANENMAGSRGCGIVVDRLLGTCARAALAGRAVYGVGRALREGRQRSWHDGLPALPGVLGFILPELLVANEEKTDERSDIRTRRLLGGDNEYRR